ncbi:hypothetical protein EON67_09990 [archaeon]|nr:MAG: hypothetical protein EON67_09990 [archaeon]
MLPELSSIQRNPETRNAWIDYSTTDAHATWLLRERLEQLLRQKPWVGSLTMFDLYNTYLCPFAQCLADMERAGIMVDVKNRLPAAEAAAVQDRKDAERIFLYVVILPAPSVCTRPAHVCAPAHARARRTPRHVQRVGNHVLPRCCAHECGQWHSKSTLPVCTV